MPRGWIVFPVPSWIVCLSSFFKVEKDQGVNVKKTLTGRFEDVAPSFFFVLQNIHEFFYQSFRNLKPPSSDRNKVEIQIPISFPLSSWAILHIFQRATSFLHVSFLKLFMKEYVVNSTYVTQSSQKRVAPGSFGDMDPVPLSWNLFDDENVGKLQVSKDFLRNIK